MSKITEDKIIEYIQKSFDNLYDAGAISERVIVKTSTNLFSQDSNIDSMSFVTVITEVEEGVSIELNQEIFIVLSDIESMFPDASSLTVQMLVNYIKSLVVD